MAFLGIRVPQDAARSLWDLEVPGVREDQSAAHITMIHFPGETPLDDLLQATAIIFEQAQGVKPFPVYTSLISSFTPSKSSDKKVPIICPINSNELMDLQKNIWEALDSAGVEFSKTFPDYRPHTTLSYADPKDVKDWKDLVIPTVSWGVHELTLFGGGSGLDRRLTVTFPLSLKSGARKMAALYKLRSSAARSSAPTE